MAEFFQGVGLLLGICVGIIAILVKQGRIKNRYISGYCRRHLVALGMAFIGGLLMLIPVVFSDAKGFVLVLCIYIFGIIAALTHYYLFICPPQKNK